MDVKDHGRDVEIRQSSAQCTSYTCFYQRALLLSGTVSNCLTFLRSHGRDSEGCRRARLLCNPNSGNVRQPEICGVNSVFKDVIGPF